MGGICKVELTMAMGTFCPERRHCKHCGRSFCLSGGHAAPEHLDGEKTCGECRRSSYFRAGPTFDNQSTLELPLPSEFRRQMEQLGRTRRRCYRDSPVLLRLLDEIREAQRKFQERQANQ